MRTGAENAGYLRADWDHEQPMDARGPASADVFGDGKLVLIPLPGHTPGTLGAAVHLDRDGSFLLASDAVSSARAWIPILRLAIPGTRKRF